MDWTQSFEFGMPSRIVFGVGCTKSTGEIARNLGSRVPMLLTDPMVHKMGLTEGVIKSLDEAGLSPVVFDGVVTEPTIDSIHQAVQIFREEKCDLIVAIGGGSAIDSAKSVTALLGNGGTLPEYQRWERKIERAGSRIIAVPTTAGTGSEVTSFSGVFDPSTGKKGWIWNDCLRPSVAICDPSLHLSIPAKVTADAGLDAFSQAVETYLNGGFKPTVDMIALKTIEIMGAYLPRAFYNGSDLEARSAMLWASTTTGLAFGNGSLTHVHTCAEMLGDRLHVPHGHLVGLMLPHVLEWSLSGCVDKMANVARALGERVEAMSSRQAAEQGLVAIRRLCADLGVNEPLRTLGLTKDDLPAIAEDIMLETKKYRFLVPRQFMNASEVVGVLEKAF